MGRRRTGRSWFEIFDAGELELGLKRRRTGTLDRRNLGSRSRGIVEILVRWCSPASTAMKTKNAMKTTA
ncbi:hypothetical protein U1Q18_010168 [Sarracenia purpurea var. burkii]